MIKYYFFVLIFFISSVSFSNNLRISNYHIKGLDIINFIYLNIDTISWENSWRNDISGTGYSEPYNRDAAWLFAKYKKKNSSVWYPAKFSDFFYSIPNNCEAMFPLDSLGIFLYRKNNGTGVINFSNLQFGFFHNNSISYLDTIDFRLMAVEMVYIPQDSFYVGDGTTTNITGQFCANDNQSPFKITSESSITLGGLGPNSLNNHNALNMSVVDDFNNTLTQSLPAAFPKGFNSVYCMKYEVTSQQYTDFLNSLDTIQAAARFANVFGTERNAIQKAGSSFVTLAPDRANNFMSWADCAAYADWIGLRPMSELEMEKIARGPLDPVANEYAWGNTTITQMTSFNGVDGSGTETGLPVNANCNYNLIDGGTGQPIGGPCRVGIFATQFSDRTSSGSSYYGVMDMTGNVWERPVSVGSAIGRLFNGLNGDGLLNTNGDANVLNWPPSTSEGSSFRMGNWFRATERARISDRFFGASAIDNRTGHRGFRCVR